MKNAYYFPHYNNARNDEKILQLRAKFGFEGYAIFFMILESMSESKSGYLNRKLLAGLSISYGLAIAQLEPIINFCVELELFKESEEGLFSKLMLEHLAYRAERRGSGSKGGKQKKLNQLLASSSATEELLAGKEKKRKEKKYIDTVSMVMIDEETLKFLAPITDEELLEDDKPF